MITYTYQWKRCDSSGGSPVDIVGATSQTYVPVTADIGKTLRCSVTATNSLGSTTVVTAQTPVIAAAPGGDPGSTANKTYTSGDFSAYLNSLSPGDIVKIATGVNPVLTGPITAAGTSGSPIKIIPETVGSKISGRLDFRGAAAYWQFENLFFDDTASHDTYDVSWLSGGSHITFTKCHFTNHNTKIGFEGIESSTYGVSHYLTFDRCHFINIGRLPYGSTNNDHGVYDVGFNLTIVDCLFENCSDRGIQLRGAENANISYTKVDHCGMGIIFGELGAKNNTVTKCVFTNRQKAGRYLVESYDPYHTNSGNTVDDCYAWNSDGSSPLPGSLSGVTLTNMHTTDPTGVSGYGPRYAVGPS